MFSNSVLDAAHFDQGMPLLSFRHYIEVYKREHVNLAHSVARNYSVGKKQHLDILCFNNTARRKNYGYFPYSV